MSDFPGEMKVSEIDLSDIDASDRRYQLSFSEDPVDVLARSIKATGLITPPVVRPLNNRYIIVSGFNRIRALCLNQEKTCLAYQTPADAQELHCHRMAITARAFKQPLTHAEQILSVHRLSEFLDARQIAQQSEAVFNTHLNQGFVEELIAIASLPAPAVALIHDKQLSLKAARRLILFDKKTVALFLQIFTQIKASQNKQLEIIVYLMEISARDGIPPETVFQQKTIQDIVFDTEKEPGVKTSLLRAFLFEQRFPILFKTRQTVAEKIESLKLGRRIKFLPPENFEGLYYTTSFTAKTYDEFKARADQLKAVSGSNALKEIFHP